MMTNAEKVVTRLRLQYFADDANARQAYMRELRETRSYFADKWLKATPQEQAVMLPDGVNICVTRRRKGMTMAQLQKYAEANPHLKAALQPLLDELAHSFTKPFLRITPVRKGAGKP